MKIKRLVVVALCVAGFLVCGAASSAQETGPLGSPGIVSQRTSAPADSRFEIIQAQSNIRTTLKLDKFTGTVYELVRNKDLVKAKDEEYVWAVTKRLAHQQDKIDSPDRVNYQIVTSAIGVRYYTFLLNLNTGASWKLSADPDKEQSYWYPVKTQ
ncbi:MAG TPA: hypothetical protein VGX92_04025 [Pyrinomonadaceae bacterium]|jgi:hypothetical protein|nr:hypothetical protein [Pyrinomonadaceae bacterium]